jgi:hypothetical protein
MIHTRYIQAVIDKIGAKSYLEIGINNPDHNFNLIKCQFKIGVDPNPNSKASFTGTSDEFFDAVIGYVETGTRCGTYRESLKAIRFDVVFIDGLHYSEQVKADFTNSLECLRDGGVIIIHDTDPAEERLAAWPRKERGRWNGDVFKFVAQLADFGAVDWRTPTVDPNGLTFVKRTANPSPLPVFKDCDYKTFKENRKEILNLCTWEECKEWI